MSNMPDNLRYSKSHEWAKQLPDGSIEIGITDHAQDLMGDMVYVELPEVGAQLSAGKECAVVESVKAASDVYAPISGEVVAVNTELADSPELANQAPYEAGWMFRVKPDNSADIEALLDVAAYREVIAAEA